MRVRLGVMMSTRMYFLTERKAILTLQEGLLIGVGCDCNSPE